MIKRRNFIGFILIAVLALVVAACDDAVDDPLGTDGDDDATEEVETPDATDDAATDDAVVEDTDDAATDDVATDDATTDDAATDDAAVDDTDDVAATDDTDADVTPDDAATDDADDAVATDDTDEMTATDDPDEILDRAAERFAELETAKFEMDGTGYIEVDEIGEVSLNDAEGQIQRPDRAEIDIAVDTAIADVPVTVVTYDGEVYIKDPVAGSTHTAPDDFQFNPAIMFDEDEGIPALIRSVQDAELLEEDDEVEGRSAYKIYGIIEGDLIQRATAGTFPATDDVDFNVWIDHETYDVLKIVAEDPTEETDSVWEMWIYDHDEPVEIDDPS